MSKNNIIIGSIAIVVLVVAAWFGVRVVMTPAPAMHAVTIGNHDVVQEVSTTGQVEAVDTHELAFGTSGIVKTVLVQKGDTVKAGQVLATLDASDIAMQRASANAVVIGDQETAQQGLVNAQTALAQLKKADAASIANATQKVLDTRTYMNKMQDIFTDVSNDGDIDTTSVTYITAAQALAAAKNSYNEAVTTLHALQASVKQAESSAESQVASAQVSQTLKSSTINASGDLSVNQAQLGYQNAVLSKTILRSPVSGVLSSVDVHVGEYASPAKASATLLSSALKITASVSEKDIASIQVGQHANITIDALGSQVFDATVTSIDPAATIDSGVASYGITLEFVKQDAAIISGMTANIAIPVAEKKNVLAVPSDAVFSNGDAYFVNIPDGEHSSHQQPVQVGIRGTNGYDEIVSGVSSGESVLSFSSK
ncbi:MAG: efflux RND transporter periplasmic adaptor subunit [Candidatus Andersenbacteria bacterium]|nr:efflux RND transporter periplasmic adaptor subunit [Candidatus Andersenbacteria bacterium]